MQTGTVAQTPGRQTYELGTGATEGLAHPLGVTIAALIKLRLLPEANIDLDAQNTAGSVDNARRLRSGDLDLAILTNLDAHDALHGEAALAEDGPAPGLRLLTNLWTSAYHFVVRRADAPSAGFSDFLALSGRRVALGANGSPLRDHARALFAAFDVDIDDSYQLADLGGRDAADAFLAGDIDGFLLVDERQGADIAAFLEEAGDDVTALGFDQDLIDAALRRGAPVWTSIVMPPGTLPGQDGERLTIGMPNLLCAREQVPGKAAYEITSTIFDNLVFLREMHASTTAISLETALDQLVIPVHDGAAAYYREVGVVLPDPLQRRVSTLSQAAFLTRFGSAEEARARLSQDTVTVLGAGAGHTAARMIGELAGMLGEAGLRVVGMTSPMPVDNIADVLYARGVDSALVPLDVLDYALEQGVYPGMRGRIVYAAEMFTEEVHLLASDAVRDLDDLIDRPVSLGPRGSVSAFIASRILDRLNILVEPSYHDERTALALLERGELAALFAVSGSPMPLLSEIPPGTGLHLLRLPPIEGDAYRPAVLTAADYPGLLATDQSVDTFGVRTALLTYDWRADSPRYRALSRFTEALFERLPALQDQAGGHHPKWREVDPLRDIEGWRRSPTAAGWIADRARLPSGGRGG